MKTSFSSCLGRTTGVLNHLFVAALACGFSTAAFAADYSLDFTAAAPQTYNHGTGGGAFNFRGIGANNDVVESLEGGEFQCKDIVTFFVQIKKAPSSDPKQTLQLKFDFLADSTGQPGVGFKEVTGVKVNYGVVQNGKGPGGTDAGMLNLTGTSVATLVEQHFTPTGTTQFNGATDLVATVNVTDIDPGETIILRVDVRVKCKPGATPTGNIQGSITSAQIIAPTVSSVSVGNQTVPFKLMGGLAPEGLSLFKSVSNDVITSGGSVTYFYLVTNNGFQTMTNVTVVDDHLGTICFIPTLAIGASVNCSQSTTLTVTTLNTATATGYDVQGDPFTSLPSSALVTVQTAVGSFTVIKSVSTNGGSTFGSSGTVMNGGSVIYKYVVTNTDGVVINNITVTDDHLGVIGTIATLGIGQSVTLTQTATLTTDDPSVINIAYGSGTDANSHALSANSNPVVVTILHVADLSVVKTDSPDPVEAGSTLTYTIAVLNSGPMAATNVVVSDPLPAGMTYLGASPAPSSGPNPVVWNLASLANGGSATFTINVRPECSAIGTVNNTATVSSGTTDPDNSNNTFTQTTTVQDTTKPTITCPPNVTVNTDPGQCSATGVALGSATASDSCGSVSVSNNAPSSFPKGTTTVTWTATDASGNTATCTQTVTVVDNQPPSITCPPNVTVNTDPGQCSASGVGLGAATATDNCPGVTVSNNAPSSFPKGTTTVTWTATDASGNTATCTQTVTVSDNQPPTITCPSDVTVNADAGQCSASGVSLGTPTAGDNCGTVTVSNNAPATFPLGATTVIWTATDVSGNSATCTQKVTVVDNQPPSITCPPNVTVNTDPGQCSATGVGLGSATASDNCPGVTVSNNAPSSFPKGTTSVTWTATDASGNTATCTQTVNVVDNEPPQITCPQPITAECTSPQGALVNFTVNATDNCPGVIVTTDLPSGAFYPVGTFTVNATATDAAGLMATCSFTIKVQDTTAPTITCPPNITTTTSPGLCGASNVALGTPTATDTCGAVTVTNDAPTLFPVGTTTVTWTAKDAAGNTSTCTQTVTVADNQPPTITCPPNVTVNTAAGQCSASGVSLGTPTTSDNCPGVTTSNNAPATFPLGSTTVTWTATDASGNTATCTQTVTVVDNQPPTITCPPNVTTNADPGKCYASNVGLGSATANDNCGSATVSNNAPATFPVGSTTVTWTATDGAGNTASCTQTVTVVDNQPPTISCPVGVTVNTDPGVCYATGVLLGSATVSDNCPGVTASNNAPATFPKGVTTVTWTATDASGKTASCTQTVTVIDNQPPTIVCPPAVTVNANAPGGATGVNLGTPTASDNCPGVTVSNNAPVTFPIGTTTVTWTATDASGKTATCTQTVTVNSVTSNVTGIKFYDANLNGVQDGGEPVIKGWKIQLIGTNSSGGPVSLTQYTSITGVYNFTNIATGIYTVKEVFPNTNWVATTTTSQLLAINTGGTYTKNFGNVARGKTGGLTIGFWKGTNGQKIINLTDAAFLNGFVPYATFTAYPKEPAGSTPFNTITLATFKKQSVGYLTSANATDMRYMLAAQLMATKLDVRYYGTTILAPYGTGVNPNAIIYTGGQGGLPLWATVSYIMNAAISAWQLGPSGTVTTSPTWIIQNACKNVLDAINNGTVSNVQLLPTPPTFTSPY